MFLCQYFVETLREINQKRFFVSDMLKLIDFHVKLINNGHTAAGRIEYLEVWKDMN